MGKAKLVTRTLTLPTGERKYFRGKTAEDADRKVNDAKMLLGMGVNIGDNTTVGELAQLWYRVYKKPQLKSPNSQAAILNAVNTHILPMLTGYVVREVTPAHIQAVMSSMSGKSESLQSKVRQCMHGMFSVAIDNGLIIKNPVTERITVNGTKTEERIPLTESQCHMLLQATWGSRLYPFIAIGLYAGLRRGEILGLRWEHVDLEAGIIHVRNNAILFDGQPTEISPRLKTPKAKRDIPIPPVLVSVLEGEKLSSKSEYVICMKNGDPLTKSAYTNLWRAVKRRTAEDSDQLGEYRVPNSPTNKGAVYALDFPVTAHLLRHTYITRLFDAGMDIKQVQYLAGHETPDITLRIYVHYQAEVRQDATAQKVTEAFAAPQLKVLGR